MIQFILTSIGVFLSVILLLVIILLVAKRYLSPSGNVNITENGDRTLSVGQGNNLMATLNENGIFLPSACGGKASCGQCKVQVLEGGGEILDSEKPHFSRKEIKDHWRLGCQCKVKGDMSIRVPESVLGVKEYECTVISNKNVATFIKEFKVQLPKGAHMDFLPGSYAQIKIPTFSIDYDKDIDKELIGDEYLPAWKKFGLFPLKCVNTEPTIRAYSMANYPAEGDVFMLTVRIATPPFKADRSGFMDVNPGIASSYIFTLKPGDKVIMSGPYGDFHPHFDSKREMIWVGGGAGMAPLRAQIMHMTRLSTPRIAKCTISMVLVRSTRCSISTTSCSLRRSILTSISISLSTVLILQPMQLELSIPQASFIRLCTTHTSKTTRLLRISNTTCVVLVQCQRPLWVCLILSA